MPRQSVVKGTVRSRSRTVKVPSPDSSHAMVVPEVAAGPPSAAELTTPVEQLAGWFTADLQKSKWKQLLDSENEQVVIRAMTYLCDRLYDKSQGGAAGKDAAVLELVVRHIGRG